MYITLQTNLIKFVLTYLTLACLVLAAQTVQAVTVPVNNFRGTWNNTKNYQAGDVVGYKYQSFIAQTENHNQTPSANSPVWYLLVAQGLQGPQGLPGIQGPQGLPGARGLQVTIFSREAGEFFEGIALFFENIESAGRSCLIYLRVPHTKTRITQLKTS